MGVGLAQEGGLCIRAPWRGRQRPHPALDSGPVTTLEASPALLDRGGLPLRGGRPFLSVQGRRGCVCERPGDCPIPRDREPVELKES